MGWKQIPTFPSDFSFSRFDEAISVVPGDTDGVYTADLRADWCIGFVPNGGYLTGLILSTATIHITTHPTLSALNQPHAIHTSTSFFNSCSPGPAHVTVTAIKTGRAYTYLRAILSQGPRTCLEAIVIFTHLQSIQAGPTLKTAPSRKIPDRSRDCVEFDIFNEPLAQMRPASMKLLYWIPKGAFRGSYQGKESVRQQWVKLRDGGVMGIPELAFLADMFFPIPENYPETAKSHWYPTLSLSLELKCAPPTEGWEWLYCRIECKEIKNGKMDVGVDIFNEMGRLVAVANQVAVIVSSARNKPKPKLEAKL